jgi:hypothetical protein
MLVVVYLVGLDGSNLLVLLDVVADLYGLIRWRCCGIQKQYSRFENCLRVPSVIDSAMVGTWTIFSAVE